MTRTSYKNQHIKEHYDRINFVIPKGEKDRIKKICSEIGASVNEYLYMLVCNDLADGTSRIAEKLLPLLCRGQQSITSLTVCINGNYLKEYKQRQGVNLLPYMHIY